MTTLTDRYVAATVRSVPARRREEIAAELRASIEDMIEARTGSGEDAATAERAVLTELGNPAELAARYTNRRMQLIGPTYYLAWLRLLKLLLSFVPATAGLLVGLLSATEEGNTGAAIGAGISTALEVAAQIAFWVTLVFAILERTSTPLPLPAWTVDQLPEEQPDRQITLCDTAVTIGFLALLVAYLPVQHFRSFVPSTDGENLPIFDPALWSFWLPFLIVVLLATVGLEIAKYRSGRWTWPLVAVNTSLALAFAVPTVWLLTTDHLFNPQFLARFGWLAENADTLAAVAAAGVVLVTLFGIVDSAVKACQNRR